VGVVTLTDSEL